MKKRGAIILPIILAAIFGLFYIYSNHKTDNAYSQNNIEKAIDKTDVYIYSGSVSLKTIKDGSISVPFQLEGMKINDSNLIYIDGVKDDYSLIIENYFEKEGLNFSLIETKEDYEDYLSVDEFVFLSELADYLSSLDGNWVEFSESDKNLFENYFSIALDSIETYKKEIDTPEEYISFNDSFNEFLTNLKSDVILEEE